MDLLIVSAIPVFVVAMALEVLVLRRGAYAEAKLLGYQWVDTRTSIALGTVHLGVAGAWKLAEVVLYAVRRGVIS